MVCNTLEILGAVNQYIDGLLREGRSSSASAMESRLSCGNPSIVRVSSLFMHEPIVSAYTNNGI